MRSFSSVRLNLALLFLSICSLYFPFYIHSTRCSSTNLIHAQLRRAILTLRPPTSPTAQTYIPAPNPVHKRLRQLATRLHTSRTCSLHTRRSERQSIEFSLVSSPLDSILVYILTVVPSRERVVLEIGGDSIAAAPLALFQQYRAVALSETWRSYDSARAFYTRNAHIMQKIPLADGLAVEAGSVKGTLRKVLRDEKVARADVVLNFAGNGDDLEILEEMTELKARVVVMRYADFMRMARVVLKGGGAGVVVIVEAMRRRGFRLVWCLALRPLAIFVNEQIQIGLETITAGQCLKERDTGVMWRRDMEALWDEAWARGWQQVR